MKIGGSGFGQEITKNNWDIGWQNFCWLMLVSFIGGLIITITFFALFAPTDSVQIVHWYFASWLSCKVPLACTPEAINNMQLLQPRLNQLTNVLNTCKIVLPLGFAGSFMALTQYFQKQGDKYTTERYIRGAKLLSPEELQTEIDGRYPETEFDLKLGRERIRLPEFLTYRHISLAGASGTGKTQAINSLLVQLQQKRNQKCLILDLNGQYYSRFGRKDDVILSLYDKRTRAWNFWSEDAPAEFFAEALIEVDGNDKFFAPAGRALLTDLFRINGSINGLWKDLTSQPKDLIKRLKGGISPALIGAEEQAAGVMATASLQLKFLPELNNSCDNPTPFSITDWCTNEDESWIYLIVRDSDLAASKPLLRTWVDLATLGVLQREEDKTYPHLWLIADELPGLGKLPTLGKLLSQGRKYLATALVGYQTSGQLEDIYGKDGAKEILQGLQNKFIFRCSDSDTSKKASLELGEQEIEEISTSIQFGKLATSDRNSLNRSIKTRPVVMPSEIQNLPDLQAYLKLCDLNPTLIHFDYQKYPQLNLTYDSLTNSRNLNSSQVEQGIENREQSNNQTISSKAKAENKNEPTFEFNPEPETENTNTKSHLKSQDKLNNIDALYQFDSESEPVEDDNFLKFDQ